MRALPWALWELSSLELELMWRRKKALTISYVASWVSTFLNSTTICLLLSSIDIAFCISSNDHIYSRKPIRSIRKFAEPVCQMIADHQCFSLYRVIFLIKIDLISQPLPDLLREKWNTNKFIKNPIVFFSKKISPTVKLQMLNSKRGRTISAHLKPFPFFFANWWLFVQKAAFYHFFYNSYLYTYPENAVAQLL